MQTTFLTLKQVAGYAVGGGHILHMVCDLTIAADNAIFGQTGPKVLYYPFSLNFKTRTSETYRSVSEVIFSINKNAK